MSCVSAHHLNTSNRRQTFASAGVQKTAAVVTIPYLYLIALLRAKQ